MCFQANPLITKEEVEEQIRSKVTWDKMPTDSDLRVAAHTYPEVPLLIVSEEETKAVKGKWGLIPSWIKDPIKMAELQPMTVNGRIETVAEKKTFMEAINQRCLFPVSGFYEWHHGSDKHKQPYYIYGANTPVLFLAGLYQLRIDVNSQEPIYTFTVLTTEANERMAYIHNTKKRMPVIVPSAQFYDFLNTENTLDTFAKPLEENYLKDHKIHPKHVLSPEWLNNPKLIEPYIDDRPIQGSLF